MAEVMGLLELTVDVLTMSGFIAQWLEHLPQHRRGHGFIGTHS